MERSLQPEPLPLSVAAENLIDRARHARYASELRGLPRDMARAALHGLRSEEVDHVKAAIDARRLELTTSSPVGLPEDVAELPVDDAAVWTPTAVLDGLPADPVELDWAERQLPNGDREL